MPVTIHIAETIRSVVKNAPKNVVIEMDKPVTLRRLAHDIGIPPVFIVFAMVDGMKKGLDEEIADNANIHFFGTMAGG